MEFLLTFIPDNIDGKFTSEHRDIGVAGVDKIMLEVGSMYLSLIQSKISIFNMDATTEKLSLDEARETGRFVHTNEIEVHVRGDLEKFIVEKVLVERKEDDKIIDALLTYEVDFDKLYKAWKAEGYPSEFQSFDEF